MLPGFLFFFLLLQSQRFYLHSIEVQGEKRVSEEFILKTFGVELGSLISPERISEGIKNLYATGYFDNILVKTFEKDSFISLTLTVYEHPRLKKIKIEGNYRIKEKEILDKISVSQGEVLSGRKLFEWKKKILELYKEKGFVDTEVKEKKKEEDGYITLTLVITEGKKAQIKKIEIYGNKKFSDEQIEKLLRNREKTWYRRAKFKEDYWKEDLPKIEEFYKEKGFLEAKVDSYKIDELEKNWIAISVFITEGKRFYLGKISFEGDVQKYEKETSSLINEKEIDNLEENHLRKLFKIREGAPLNYKKLQQSIAEIQGSYADRGYLLVRVFPEESIRDSFIDFKIHISKGNLIFVRLIHVKGNTRTRDYVIIRELDITPGMKFSRELLIKSQRDLFFLNFFENVLVDFDVLPDSQNVDLTFEVKEKPTGTIQAGASYSQLQGLSFFAQFSQPNLFGRGQILNLYAEFGKYRKNYQISFTEPWMFQKPYTGGFDVHDVNNIIPGQYEERRQGFSLFFSRPILGSDYYRWRIKYSPERIFFSGLSSAYEQDEEWPKISSSLENTFTRDTRDRVFNEKKGTRISYQNTLSGFFLGGNIHFHKHISSYALFVPFFKEKIVHSFFFKFGGVGVFKKGQKLPSYEKFRPGGVFSEFPVRGYSDWSIGPSKKGTAVGGRFAFLFSYEFRVPLSNTLYLLLFYDAGNAWSNSSSFWIDWKNLNPPLYRGAGIGVRIEIPMMPILGFDIGYGFDNPKDKFVPHFQFGTRF